MNSAGRYQSISTQEQVQTVQSGEHYPVTYCIATFNKALFNEGLQFMADPA